MNGVWICWRRCRLFILTLCLCLCRDRVGGEMWPRRIWWRRWLSLRICKAGEIWTAVEMEGIDIWGVVWMDNERMALFLACLFKIVSLGVSDIHSYIMVYDVLVRILWRAWNFYQFSAIVNHICWKDPRRNTRGISREYEMSINIINVAQKTLAGFDAWKWVILVVPSAAKTVYQSWWRSKEHLFVETSCLPPKTISGPEFNKRCKAIRCSRVIFLSSHVVTSFSPTDSREYASERGWNSLRWRDHIADRNCSPVFIINWTRVCWDNRKSRHSKGILQRKKTRIQLIRFHRSSQFSDTTFPPCIRFRWNAANVSLKCTRMPQTL